MIVLINIYDNHVYELKCENRLNRFIQINLTAFYIQIFQNLMISLDIDDKFQYIMFYDKFNDKVKEVIIIARCKSKIQSLINQAINLDQMFY